MLRRFLILILAILLSATLWGCSSNRDSSGVSTTDPDTDFGVDENGIAFTGSGSCTTCHQDLSFSVTAVADYLASKHVVHSLEINQASPDECFECHDPQRQGETLEPFIDPADVPADGLAAVGCEDCHGAGGEHFGIGPIPDFNPDFEVCGKCHNELPEDIQPDHPLFAPFGNNILDNYKLSAHIGSTEPWNPEVPSPCFRCHSDEGFQEFIGVTVGLDADELTARLDGVAPIPDATPVQCRTCHDPHSGELRAPLTERIETISGTTETGAFTVFSRQFNLCTACHQVFLDATFDETNEVYNYELDDTRRPFHGSEGGPTDGTRTSRVIWDTHFLLPDAVDPVNNPPQIVGYNINAADEQSCTQCHDAHGSTKFEQVDAQEIAERWGGTELFHGDYQNFPTINSQPCARCHSGTEYVKFVNGVPDEELLGGEARVIACISCHDLQAMNAAGDGFELGPLRVYASETITFPPFPQLDDPDAPTGPDISTVALGENSLCVGCHLGRRGKGSVDEAIDNNELPIGRNDNHHGYAAATQYGTLALGGYEYDDQMYAAKFEHVESNNACNECHGVHGDPDFPASDINTVFIDTCSICHPAVNGDNLETLKDIRILQGAVDHDGDGIITEGIFFEIQTLWDFLFVALETEFGEDPLTADTTDETLTKAQYNLNFADMFGDNFRDNGAYAHNPYYVIQLLVDSLATLDITTNTVTGNAFIRDRDGHFDSSADAFRHWDEDPQVPFTCSNCHTNEGAAFFLDTGTQTEEYVETADTNGVSSRMACESCHQNPFNPSNVPPGGQLRDFFQNNLVVFPANEFAALIGEDPATFAKETLGDSSNICMTCHQGRESGLTVLNEIQSSPGPFSFINRHYFAAAAIMFGEDVAAGFQYDGRTYLAQNTFPAHVGFNINKETCVECHTPKRPPLNETDHRFVPLISDCSACHSDVNNNGAPLMDFDDLGTAFSNTGSVDYDGDGVAGSFQSEIDGLEANLLAEIQDYAANVIGTGIFYEAGAYPYWFNEGGPAAFPNRYVSFDATLLAAAYNYHSNQDPCSDIHNYRYVIQTTYDSIDVLDDGVLNNSVTNPVTNTAAIRP